MAEGSSYGKGTDGMHEITVHLTRMPEELYWRGLSQKVAGICISQGFRRDIRQTEIWPEFGEDLRILVDKAYPALDDEAWQQLALQRYLSQLDNEQVAFGVKQRKPKTIEAAVSITLECESF